MEDKKEKLSSTNINWFPGHMAKTRREIEEDLKLVDVVVELLDARIPISSQNPEIAKITKEKKKLIVLNKIDLADEKENKKWVNYFEKQNIPVCLVDSNSGKGIDQCIKQIEKMMQAEQERLAEKGRIGRKIRVMIVGIPNVGKSSFINRIAKKATAGVGNKPGFTKQKQWIRINEKVELLDTPGVLWPKFESEKVALNLSFTGTIKEEILDRLEVAYHLVKFLLENHREVLLEKYKLEESYVENILSRDLPENENIYEIMLEMGKKRGCLISGGNVDEEKIAKIILDEFKNGKLGKITIETR
ncbi:MAG: ribosome biogenesis GTPase YlqF [Clostridia bacterium]|nr:ribosome biogenesis GTPase YlqF [Clostridia bacterium]